MLPTGYTFELAVPFAELGDLKPVPGSAVGFDFLIHDADLEEKTKKIGVVRWAGQCKTMGQLFFAR